MSSLDDAVEATRDGLDDERQDAGGAGASAPTAVVAKRVTGTLVICTQVCLLGIISILWFHIASNIWSVVPGRQYLIRA